MNQRGWGGKNIFFLSGLTINAGEGVVTPKTFGTLIPLIEAGIRRFIVSSRPDPIA
ncbi:MAG TPA: hypothetical protein VLH40_03445 [Atribacteraceae bacterium]|nr:hypothetical protein [Atribacteraceae bacterium]